MVHLYSMRRKFLTDRLAACRSGHSQETVTVPASLCDCGSYIAPTVTQENEKRKSAHHANGNLFWRNFFLVNTSQQTRVLAFAGVKATVPSAILNAALEGGAKKTFQKVY
jgi:hypothetical protein